MSHRELVSVVGGGLGGLVAAIACAESGNRVVLYEARTALGGRARSTGPPFIADLGPHALYADGAMWSWLDDCGLLPATHAPAQLTYMRGFNLQESMPEELILGAIRLPEKAPTGDPFGSWARAHVADDEAHALEGILSLVTYDAEPGRFSAAWCRDWLSRVFAPQSPVRYVTGGWQRLVDGLVERATAMGVELKTGTAVRELPPAPVVVATPMGAARRLLSDPSLKQEETAVVLLDLGLEAAADDPAAVLDLDRRVYAARYSATDPSRSPEGMQLIQAMSGALVGESPTDGVARIEAVLDDSFVCWRTRVRWRRSRRQLSATGAVQLPGTSRHDRPSPARGGGVHLVGDAVDAPGNLSEVSWASAVAAAASVTGNGPSGGASVAGHLRGF